MFDILPQYSIFQKVIMNTLFVSIPEEFYFVMFILILVGEFEYWKEPGCKRLINKFDYSRVFLPTGVVALLSNILRYYGLAGGIYQYIPLIVLYILIVLTNDIFGDASAIRWMGKTFIALTLGFMSIGVSEFIYMPFVIFSTGLNMTEISNNFLLYFTLSLPARFIQYSILLYLVCRKRTLLRGRLSKYIFANSKLSILFSFFGLFNVAYIFVMYKAVVYDKALVLMSLSSQIITVIGIILFPLVNTLGLMWIPYYVKNLEAIDKKNAAEKLQNLINKIEVYTNNGEYDNIRWKLNEIGIGIEEVSNSLNRDNETDKHR